MYIILSDQWEQAWTNQDVNAAIDQLSDDVVVVFPDEELRGKDIVASQRVERFAPSGAGSDLVYESGRYTRLGDANGSPSPRMAPLRSRGTERQTATSRSRRVRARIQPKATSRNRQQGRHSASRVMRPAGGTCVQRTL